MPYHWVKAALDVAPLITMTPLLPKLRGEAEPDPDPEPEPEPQGEPA